MITKSAQVSAYLANPTHTAALRVFVANSAGTLKHVATLVPGADPTISVEIEESVDDHRHCTITLQRQVGYHSLAPLIDNLTAGQPATALARKVVIDVAIQPAGGDATLSSIDTFNGYIDRIEWPDDMMVLQCSDQSAKLRDTFIERERVYGLCTGAYATKGAYIWNDKSDAPALVVGDLVLPSKLNANGHFYRVTAAASPQLTTEPTWPTGGGSTVVSGGVTLTESGSTSTTGIAVETIMQQILDDNGLSAFTLSVPVSPSWIITPYIQQRESVLDALTVFAEQIGWNLRFSKSTFALTLSAPDRAATVAVKTIAATEECEFSELSEDITEIRNVVAGIYGDASSRDGEGAPTRIRREVSDATSITKYGRRFMEISEASNSNIDSSSEMDQMINAVLADLKEPTAIASISFPVDPYLELGDLIQFPADSLRFQATQKLAIVAMRDRYEAKGQRTTITVGGQPVARRTGWLAMDTRIAEDRGHQLQILDTQGPSVTITPTIGGARTRIGGTVYTRDPRAQGFEVHISDTPGFTPSSATMVSNGEQAATTVAQLVPNKVYYTKLVPYAYNATRKIYGAPSTEQAFVAGRARSGHYDPASTQGHLPLNGNFEHAIDDLSSFPPDHWALGGLINAGDVAPTWGASGSVYFDTDTDKGGMVKLQAHATQRGALESSIFEIRRGQEDLNFHASIRLAAASLGANKELTIRARFFSDADGSTAVFTADQVFLGDGSSPVLATNTWYDVWWNMAGFSGSSPVIPTNANFCQITLFRGIAGSTISGGTNYGWDIGDVFVIEADLGGQFFVDFARIRQDAAIDGDLTMGGTITTPNLIVSGLSHVRAKTSSAGSYATGATIQYGTEDYDTLNEYSTSTYKFTATKAGKYLVTAAIFCDTQSYNSGNSVQLGVKKNSTVIAYGLRAFAPSTASWFLTSNVTTVIDLAVSDTLEIIISHDRAAGNVTLWTGSSAGNYFCVERLS